MIFENEEGFHGKTVALFFIYVLKLKCHKITLYGI